MNALYIVGIFTLIVFIQAALSFRTLSTISLFNLISEFRTLITKIIKIYLNTPVK